MAELEVANTAGRKEETVTNIKVAVRCRPMSSTEKAKGEQSCFRIENGTACLQNPTNPSEIHRFGFDLLYDGDSEQVDIWRDVGVPALEKAFAGFNTTVFAYGQTGSGKTFSMQGDASVGGGGEQAGVIPRMNRELFARIAREKAADPNKMFLATCAYFEIYNEVIYDLLDPNNRKSKGSGLEIREHSVLGIYVKGLQEMVVTSPENTQKLIDQGMLSRTVGSTAMNDTSSRSHSVLTVKIHQKDASDGSKSTFAKINLVDLAGSERAKSTGAKGARLKEGANINKSLSSLGNVINALVEVANGKKGVFVPYRNSKLTRVLQESLGGNSLTAMLAALSPAACNFDETLSTLKYASRAKSIKVNAVKNEEASQVSRLEEEIRSLKQKLAERASQASVPAGLREGREGQGATPCETGARVGSPSGANAAAISFGDGGGPDGTSREDRYKQQIAEMEAAMKSTWEEKASQSQAMERERLRLQRKLEEEARREERERKKRWRALEDKGDLELSIRETRDAALPTLPAKDWLRRTRALAEAENRKREESTVCGVYREALVREVEAAFDHDGPGEEAGWVPRGRGLPSAHSYDAAMLRQLQARISSLRGARERLYGPLTEAVEEASRDLLESVEAFSKTLAASPRAGHPEKEVLEGGCRGGSSVGGDVGAGLRAGADATGKGRRWEARRREGTRALLMIRRQIMERGRRRRQQRRRQSGDSLPRDRVNEDISFLPGGERAAEGASARADGEKGPEDEPEDDIEALIQAAALLERAIEAILPDDRRSAFAYAARDGREKASAPDDSAPCGLDMVREGENCVDGDGDGDGEGGGDLSDTDDDDMMPSELDEAPYRTVLTTLNEALLCLRSSISSARLEAELETAIDSLSTPAAGVEDAAALGPHTTGIVDGRPDSGDATSSSGDLSPGRFSGEKSRSMEEGILPDASRWGFRVSPGGWARAEGGGFESAGSADVDERKRKREGEESEDVLTSREKRQCASFRWNTGLESRTAPASLESERTMEVDGRKIREGDTCWVKLDFPEDAAVSSVTVQILDGQGRAKQDDNPIGSLGSAVEAPVPLALSSCGLKDVDGSIERTEALLGAVLGGWGSILKSTPPSKLLTRPPVRFLYDLFRAVARETGFGTEVISSDSTWEELTGKREKLQLMDSMVRHVSDTLGLKAPPARGSDIIVGKECSATNRFLQLLALAAHDHRQRATQRVGSGDDNGNGDGDGDGEVDDCSVNDGTPGGCSAWTRRLRVEVSRDGDTWEALLVAEASEERTRERFATWRTSTSTATRCRSMRLTVPALGENRSGEPPDRGADDGHGECSRSPREARPALIRVGVEGLRDGAGESKRRRQRRRRHTRGDRGDRGDPEAVDSSQGHQARAGALLDAMDVAVRCLLDQALEWRRIASANRERRMAFRTNQMESLEKSLKAAEEGNMRLAKERKVLMEKAARIEGEKLDLKEEVLRLTADIGRERVENTSITEKLAQAELRLDEDKAQLSELEALKIALHGEADDLQNQVEVLIEERDIARSNEEELFARLMEKNEDLEALQESYVSLTDRWNDFQDEHDELQEQVDRLRHTLRLTTATTPEAADASHNGGERPETYHVEQRRLDEQESHGTSQDEWERGQGCTGTLQALKPSVNRSTNDDDSPAGSGKRESHLLQGFQGDTPQPSKPGSRQDGPDLPCDESHQAGRVTLAEKVPMPAASNDPRGANDCGGASAPTAGTTLPLNKSETVGLPMESGHYEDDFHDFSDSDEGNHRHVQQSRATVDTEHKQRPEPGSQSHRDDHKVALDPLLEAREDANSSLHHILDDRHEDGVLEAVGADHILGGGRTPNKEGPDDDEVDHSKPVSPTSSEEPHRMPPTRSNKVKPERPKSAARQGRSASLNAGAG